MKLTEFPGLNQILYSFSTGANSPRSISVVSSVQYFPEIPCIEASTASSILKSNLGSSLSCAVNGSCSIDVTTTGMYALYKYPV